MAIANICQHDRVASWRNESSSNVNSTIQAPGPFIADPENFEVTGAGTYELATGPAPTYCIVGAVSGTLYVRSGVSGGSIAEGEGKVVFAGTDRPIYIEKGHTHLLFFGA